MDVSVFLKKCIQTQCVSKIETYLCEKRPMYVKRDLEKRPMYRNHTALLRQKKCIQTQCVCKIETFVCEKRPMYVKRDLEQRPIYRNHTAFLRQKKCIQTQCASKIETFVCEKRPMYVKRDLEKRPIYKSQKCSVVMSIGHSKWQLMQNSWFKLCINTMCVFLKKNSSKQCVSKICINTLWKMYIDTMYFWEILWHILKNRHSVSQKYAPTPCWKYVSIQCIRVKFCFPTHFCR